MNTISKGTEGGEGFGIGVGMVAVSCFGVTVSGSLGAVGDSGEFSSCVLTGTGSGDGINFSSGSKGATGVIGLGSGVGLAVVS